MKNIDVFESAFKRALRTPFEYKREAIERVLFVTDLEPEPLKDFEAKVIEVTVNDFQFLSILSPKATNPS